MEPTVQKQQPRSRNFKITKKNVIRAVLSIFLLSIFAAHNLATNALYYAERTPHKEGMDAAMIELFENPDWVHNPSMVEYNFNLDGNPAVIVSNDKGSERGYTVIVSGSGQPHYMFSDSRRGLKYEFDKEYNLVAVFDSKRFVEVDDISGFDEGTIKQELRNLYQPLIDAQPAPLINLQFLYDYINYDRFN